MVMSVEALVTVGLMMSFNRCVDGWGSQEGKSKDI